MLPPSVSLSGEALTERKGNSYVFRSDIWEKNLETGVPVYTPLCMLAPWTSDDFALILNHTGKLRRLLPRDPLSPLGKTELGFYSQYMLLSGQKMFCT